MRRSRGASLAGLAVGLIVAAVGAAAICQPMIFHAIPGLASPGSGIPPQTVAPPAAPAQAPIAPIAAPTPPPIAAIGRDRSFTSAQNTWLRPGRSIWRPELARSGPIGIVIDLSRQMAYVYRTGTLIGVTTVSTGRRHHETPVGSFPILEKAVWHRSTIYSGAPMPYMQRLTWGGVALHAGGVPGYRQSHGCIHLPAGFARSLFKTTSIGAEVRIVRRFDDAMPRVDPAMALAVATPGTPFPTTAQSAAEIVAAAL